jgi:ABC-type phosphate/phosphonate transport system substrate-binding protein
VQEPRRGCASARAGRGGWLVALLWLLLSVSAARAEDQTSATLVAERGLLRIGYLRREETGHPGEAQLEEMRRALLAEAGVKGALEAAGYTGIGILPCDGASDMLRRLNAREFDLAFTPASLYLQQQSGYTAVLMARRSGDVIGANGLVLRCGAVIVSNRSPLFGVDKAAAGEVRAALMRGRRIGVVSTQSVAGFYAPLLSLSVSEEVEAGDVELVWYETSEEVVKAVLSGLVDVGACEREAVGRVLEADGLSARGRELLHELIITDPIPSDPIVARASLAQRNGTLLRLLTGAIRNQSKSGTLSDIQYVPTEDREYGRLHEMLKEFRTRFGQVSP